MKVLKKGFNFAVTPKSIPKEEIICNIESGIQKLPKQQAEEIRQEVATILRKAKPPESNLTTEERLALKELKQDESILVLTADKGNATVVLDTEDYKQKMHTLLAGPTYKEINTDPTTYLEKTTKALINKSSIDEATARTLIPREKSSICPKLYGLPKIHKENMPLRPIVSSIGSPTQQLARYIAKLWQPIAEKADSYIKNSNEFLDKI